MLRVALTLSAVVAYAPQSATKQAVRSGRPQQRGLTTVSASSFEPEAERGFGEVLQQGAGGAFLPAAAEGEPSACGVPRPHEEGIAVSVQ